MDRVDQSDSVATAITIDGQTLSESAIHRPTQRAFLLNGDELSVNGPSNSANERMNLSLIQASNAATTRVIQSMNMICDESGTIGKSSKMVDDEYENFTSLPKSGSNAPAIYIQHHPASSFASRRRDSFVHEPGEVLDLVAPTGSPSPPPSPTSVTPPPMLTALNVCPRSNENSYSRHDSSSESSGRTRNSAAYGTMPADHCYGLPYQDHNYGTANFSSGSRATNGSSGGGAGIAAGSSGSANQTNHSNGGTHRISMSSSSGNNASSNSTSTPPSAGRQSLGSGTPFPRRSVYFAGASLSKPPTLAQYGPATVSSSGSVSSSETRISPTGGFVDRNSFSDDDGAIVRPDAYNLMSTGVSTTSNNSNADGDCLSSSSGASPMSGYSNAKSSFSYLSKSGGVGAAHQQQTTGITVTTAAARQRLRGTPVRQSSSGSTEFTRGYHHGTPAIHPRLAPPNLPRSGAPVSPVSASVFANERRLTGAGDSNYARHQRQRIYQQRHSPSLCSGQATLQILPQPPHSNSLGAHVSDDEAPLPPPKRPGRPKGARPGGQQQQRQRQQLEAGVSRTLVPKRRRFQATHHPHEASLSSFSDMLSEPADGRDTVTSVLDAVAAGLTTNPYRDGVKQIEPMSDNAGRPPAVGTSAVIPAHPMFANTSTPSVLGSSQQRQSILNTLKTETPHQEPAPPVAPAAKSETFIESYKNIMTDLYKRVGISDEEEDEHSPEAKGQQRRQQRRPESKRAIVVGQQQRSPLTKTEKRRPNDANDETTKVVNGYDKNETSSSSGNSDDEWAGQDYTTRCLCKLDHNDEFMIQCDRCEVWQHCECMGVDTANVPENYLCEQCNPRVLKLTRDEARRLQESKVLKYKRRKAAAAARRRRTVVPKRLSTSSGRGLTTGVRGRPRKNIIPVNGRTPKTSLKQKISSDLESPRRSTGDSNSYVDATKNLYSAKFSSAFSGCPDTNSHLLSQNPSTFYKVMFVDTGRQGLVSTQEIPIGTVIGEYRGRTCLASEITDQSAPGSPIPFVLYYRGCLTETCPLDVCVDARIRGTGARFVRRSCQPNSQVKHVVRDGVLHFVLVSAVVIERSVEITIPFDFDYRQCKSMVDCACSTSLNPSGDCMVKQHNQQLSIISAGQPDSDKAKTDERVKTEAPVVLKRRPGRPPGSGKLRRNNVVPVASAVAAMARKKSRNARGLKGLKVKIPDRKAKRNAGMTPVPGRSATDTSRSELSRRGRQPSTSEKRPTVAPTTTSAPVVLEVTKPQKPALVEAISPASTSGFGSGADSRSSTATAAATINEQQPLSREERKMRVLMEQISRMEQREKKKVQKLQATRSDASERRGRGVGRPGKEKRSSMDSSTAAARRTRAESETTGWNSGPMKRARLMSEGGVSETTSSALSSDDGEWESDGKQFAVESGVQNQLNTNAAVPQSNMSAQLKTDVAKKRWLRQAMSEESAAGKVVLSVPVTVNTANLPESVASQGSPPIATPLKKRLVIQEFNTSSSISSPPMTQTESTKFLCSTDATKDDAPMSTAEAAELLAQMQQCQMATTPETTASSLMLELQHQSDPPFECNAVSNILCTSVNSQSPPKRAIEPDYQDMTANLTGIVPASVASVKKKVKVSLDEYKKRKRESVNEMPGSNGDLSSTSSTSLPTEEAAIPSGATTSVTSAPSQPSGSRQQSFIPHIQEGDEEARHIRLSTLPDPRTIGKSSATMEELRERIYGRSFIRRQMAGQLSNAGKVITPNDEQAAGATPPNAVPSDVFTKADDVVTSQVEKASEGESTEFESPEPVQRMSLMDRLRTEFGLDDATNNSSGTMPETQHGVVSSQRGIYVPPQPPLAVYAQPVAINSATAPLGYVRPPVAVGAAPPPPPPLPPDIQRMMGLMLGAGLASPAVNSNGEPTLESTILNNSPSSSGSMTASDDEERKKRPSGGRQYSKHRLAERGLKDDLGFGKGRRRRSSSSLSPSSRSSWRNDDRKRRHDDSGGSRYNGGKSGN